MFSLRIATFLFVLVLTAHAVGQMPNAAPPIIARATQVVEKNQEPRRYIGLAEIQRVHGFKQAGLDELRKAAASAPKSAELQELLCWRMLPVAPAQRDVFR